MTAVAGKTATGKVWHVAVFAHDRPDHQPYEGAERGRYVALCGAGGSNSISKIDYLATVPAFGLCQKCERASEQIARAIAEVQS